MEKNRLGQILSSKRRNNAIFFKLKIKSNCLFIGKQTGKQIPVPNNTEHCSGPVLEKKKKCPLKTNKIKRKRVASKRPL